MPVADGFGRDLSAFDTLGRQLDVDRLVEIVREFVEHLSVLGKGLSDLGVRKGGIKVDPFSVLQHLHPCVVARVFKACLENFHGVGQGIRTFARNQSGDKARVAVRFTLNTIGDFACLCTGGFGLGDGETRG